MLALEFIDRDSDEDMADARSATAWLGERRIRSDLPAGAERALALLRAAIADALRSAASGMEPSPASLERLNAASAAAPAAPQVNWASGGRPRSWLTTNATPEQHVHALLARSAIELLAGDDLDLLTVCAAPGCGRLFLATNSRRLWCSTACGNRVRVARHASRVRTQRPATG